MEIIKGLNRFQQVVLIVLTAMVLGFSVVYPITLSKEGFAYKNNILVPKQENGNTVYSGKIKGKQAIFTVSADKTTVAFQYGDKAYAPYVAKEDYTAVPKKEEMAKYMTGVELRQEEKVLFRGGILDQGDYLWIYNEDGTLESLGTYGPIDGIEWDGNDVDEMEPSFSTILELMFTPKLTHKGEGLAWFCGVLICIATAISILFADELFRWNLSFRIRDVDQAEPSEWEMTGRYIGWFVMPIMAMIIFIMGLQ